MKRAEATLKRLMTVGCLVVVFLVASGLSGAVFGAAIADPNVIIPPPGGGGCPSPYSIDLGASVSTNPTNATITLWATSSSPLPWGFANVHWGPNTNYGYTANTGQSFGTQPTGVATDFIDYLEPSTTYYFHIHAYDSCTDSSGTHQYVGDYYGSWTTGSDSMTTFSGVVADPNGNTLSGGNMWVWAYCANYPPGTMISGSFSDWTSSYTSGSGHYSLGEPNWYDNNLGYEEPCTSYGGGGYAVGVVNYDLWLDELNMGNSPWNGHWNETMIVWAPQIVNFNLQLNYKTYVPASAEFVHTTHADISSYSTEIYTTTADSWNYGGTGGSTSQTGQAGWGTTSVPSGDNLRVDSEFWTSGAAVFNALQSRQVTLSGLQFFDQAGASFNVNGWSDWQTSAPANGYCSKFNTPSTTFTLTLSGSVTVSSGYDFDIGVSAGGPYASGSVSVPIQNTLESTSGYSTSVTFTLTNPYYPSYAYFLVNTEGGSSPSSASAIVAHVWLVGSC